MKLTKQQFREKFTNTKVYVNGKSDKIQYQLFKAGITWSNSRWKVSYTDKPFLFIGKHPTMPCIEITNASNMVYFKGHSYREVTAEEILSIEIVNEPTKHEFKPFDKVVARDNKDGYSDVWTATLFSHIDNNGHYIGCDGIEWDCCLPFNDSTAKLIGTTDDYEEEQS